MTKPNNEILQRFQAECLSLIGLYIQREHVAISEMSQLSWKSKQAGIMAAVAVLRRLTESPADAGLRVDDAAMRDSIKQLADEWCVHASNGMDVLASQCLDEIEAKVQAVRP